MKEDNTEKLVEKLIVSKLKKFNEIGNTNSSGVQNQDVKEDVSGREASLDLQYELQTLVGVKSQLIDQRVKEQEIARRNAEKAEIMLRSGVEIDEDHTNILKEVVKNNLKLLK